MINQILPSKIPLIDIPLSLAADIVSAIYDVGDKMKEKAALNQYVTHNHDKIEFWDALNTNVCQVLDSSGCLYRIAKSGFWEFLLVDHEPSNLIFTFMRERRFKEIKKSEDMTYVNELVRHFNKNLLAPISQMALFPINENVELSDDISKLVGDVEEESNLVKHYMMVLFDCDSYHELRGIRAVIADSRFDIVEEEDWSHYIPVKETLIVEKVPDTTLPSNNPSRGLSLKPKALERKILKNEFPLEDDENSKK